MNFLILPKVSALLRSMHWFSITCASMLDFMRTLMPTNVIAFAEA
jgi:hypothetical protein